MINYDFHNYLELIIKLDYGMRFCIKVLPICNLNKKLKDIFIDNVLLSLRYGVEDNLK